MPPVITFAKLKELTKPSAGSSSVNQDLEEPCMDVGSKTAKKSRGDRWQADELKTLIEAIEPVYDIVFAPNSSKVTENDKDREWLLILNKVNAVSMTKRSIQSCKAKWSDFASRVRVKVRHNLKERRKTGGGENDHMPMSEVENLLGDIINHNEKKAMNMIGTTSLFGVPGGLDTSAPEIHPTIIDPVSNDQITLMDTGSDEVSEKPNFVKPDSKKASRDEPGKELIQIQRLLLETTKMIGSKLEDIGQSFSDTNASLSRVAGTLEKLLWFYKFKLGLNPNLPSSAYVVNGVSQVPSSPP